MSDTGFDVSYFDWAVAVVADGGTLESGEVELLAAEAQKLRGENVDLRRALRRAEYISPQPEIRGYVVLIPSRHEPFEIGAAGSIFSDAGTAIADAAWAEQHFGLTGAHVGVVTALPPTIQESSG